MATPFERPPLYSIEAEEAVLGSIMINPDALPQVAFLAARDFHREAHQWLFQAMVRLHERGDSPDAVTVMDELERVGRLADVGGPAVLSEMMLRVPTAIHAEHYGRIVERNAVLRRLVDAAERIAKLAYGETESELGDILARAETEVFRATQRATWREPVSFREVLHSEMDRLLDLSVGILDEGSVHEGSAKLHELLRGFKPGFLYLLAARPGMGKSSLMNDFARGVLRAGGKALVFSLEMSRAVLVQRLLASETGLNLQVVSDGPIFDGELERLSFTCDDLGGQPGELLINDERGLSPSEIRSKALRLAAKGLKPDIIFVDHLQEVGDRGIGNQQSTRADIVAAKARAFRNLAGELGVPLMLLCQLNRACEERQDKRPMLSDLKDSGGLEEAADVVMFIYRDDVYNRDTERPNIAELLIKKHRNGPTGTVERRFERTTGRWSDLETYGDHLEQEERFVPAHQRAGRAGDEIDF